jgi:surfeit locus 1 family protein
MAQIDAAPIREQVSGPLNGRLRRLVGPTIATVVGFAILCSLGDWQIHRLAWKENLLAEIGSRVHAPPQPLPSESAWPTLSPEDYEYRHVELRGVFENSKEALVFDPGGEGKVDEGPGYLVLTPLRLDDGAHVIVDRGFVPMDFKNPATRASSEISGETTVVGLMRSPEPRNWFTPADDPAKGDWFTRDPIAMAKFFHLTRAAPFSIDADPVAEAPFGAPAGGATALNIPNNHFSYAVTWFGLAGTLIGVYLAFAWRRLKEP